MNRFIRVCLGIIWGYFFSCSAVQWSFDDFTFADIIHGKLDQKNKQLEVDYAIGRDIRPEDISKISSTLQEWCDSCESVLHTIEIQIDRANAAKAVRTKHTEDLEAEVSANVCLGDNFDDNFRCFFVDCNIEENPQNSPHRNRRRLRNGLQRVDVIDHLDHTIARSSHQKTKKQSHETIVGR